MRETLQLHASIVDRNHHIQTMVRTIKCQLPAGANPAIMTSSAVVPSAQNMQMAATAPGYVYNGHSSHSLSTAGAVSSQRPLVELSEVEAARTCAVKVYANSATTVAPFATSEVKWRLLVLFSVQYYLFLK